MRALRRTLPSIVAATTAMGPAVAAASGPRPAGIERVQVQSGDATLTAEAVDIDCDATLQCEARVRWTLRAAPSPTGAERTLAFFADQAQLRRVTINGVPVDIRVRRLETPDGGPSEDRPAPSRVRVAVPLPRSATALEVEVLASLRPRRAATTEWVIDGRVVRHPVLTEPPDERELFYGGATPVEGGQALAAPPTSTVSIEFQRPWRRVRRPSIDSTRVARGIVRVRPAPDDHGVTRLQLRRGAPLPGGPIAAVGLGMGQGNRRAVVRAGYEIGSAPFLIHSAVVESDFADVSVVPATEVATANVALIVPSVSLGVGLPVRVFPRPRVGIRTQAALSWPVFSLVGTFDVFVGPNGDTPRVRGGLFAQFGI